MKRGLSGASGARRKHKTRDETGALLLGLDPLGPFKFPDTVVRMQHPGEECRDAATIWTKTPDHNVEQTMEAPSQGLHHVQ